MTRPTTPRPTGLGLQTVRRQDCTTRWLAALAVVALLGGAAPWTSLSAGTLTADASVPSGTARMIASGKTLVVPSGLTLTIELWATLEVEGTLVVDPGGKVVIQSGGELLMAGSGGVDNSGDLFSEGLLENSGDVWNHDDGYFESYGTFDDFRSFVNNGYVETRGPFTNESNGTAYNQAIWNNEGDLVNWNLLVNRYRLDDQNQVVRAVFYNYESVDNQSLNATFENVTIDIKKLRVVHQLGHRGQRGQIGVHQRWQCDAGPYFPRVLSTISPGFRGRPSRVVICRRDAQELEDL